LGHSRCYVLFYIDCLGCKTNTIFFNIMNYYINMVGTIRGRNASDSGNSCSNTVLRKMHFRRVVHEGGFCVYGRVYAPVQWTRLAVLKRAPAYALMLELGFEAALCCHVLFAVYKGVQVQLRLGNHRTFRYLILAVLSCAGFVVLKLLDHWLAQFWVSRRVTGHFWSKVCDVLQFHYSFCFLTTLAEITHKVKD
uniref:Transmembrane protein 187 n=1 Tax=Neogobius melanostomus TaxID=47308 RepID=A0A8C6WUA4_9GOBI